MSRQLSLFAADLQPPQPGDLVGLLAGPATAVPPAELRVSVVDPARAAALAEELTGRGFTVTAADDPTVVRIRPGSPGTDQVLAELTSHPGPPAELVLDAQRLRLWCLAAGQPDRAGYRLLLNPAEEAWPRIGAALSGIGVAVTLIGPGGAAGPSYRVVGARRLTRLRELVGEPPWGVVPADWPAG